jgi:hypothetical protein
MSANREEAVNIHLVRSTYAQVRRGLMDMALACRRLGLDGMAEECVHLTAVLRRAFPPVDGEKHRQ